MKEHRILDQHDEEAAEQSLFRAILSLRDQAEVRAFLVDLCTPAELQALKDRWLVAELLDRDLLRQCRRRQQKTAWQQPQDQQQRAKCVLEHDGGSEESR